MRIHLISVGTRAPAWVQQGWLDYARRLPAELAPRLVEITPYRRHGGADPERARREEWARIAAAIPRGARLIALECEGEPWSSGQLAHELDQWRREARDVALLVGGPDGLDRQARACAERRWSLSPLTFPHALVRVLVVEQLYRAWTILQHHPYHR